MPSIDFIDGIKINIYFGDHRPPHIHAIYNEYEVLIRINDHAIYAGELPDNQLKKVMNWLQDNSEWALMVFYELNPNLK